MKVLLLIAALLTSINQPDAKEIIGTWRVKEVMVTKSSETSENEKAVAYMKSLMLKTTFIIKANHQFGMLSPKNITGLQMPPCVWTYDTNTHILHISEPKDPKSRLAKIMIYKDKSGEMCFSLAETPFILKVYK